jgi:hypothetical protein
VLDGRGRLHFCQLRPNPVPDFVGKGLQRLYRTHHDLKLDHFALVVELDEIDALELPSADIGRKFQCGVVGAGDEAAVVGKILEKSAPRSSAPAKSRRGRGSAIAR